MVNTGTGTVTSVLNNKVLAGAGTLFTSELVRGGYVIIGSEMRLITGITNDTQLNIESPFTVPPAGVAFTYSDPVHPIDVADGEWFLDFNGDSVWGVITKHHKYIFYDQPEGILIDPVPPLKSPSLSGTDLSDINASLTGSLRTINVVESLINGSTDSGVQSVAIAFLGDGGTLDGETVFNNFSASFSPNKGADTVGAIAYTVPTSGQLRVLITYVR